MPTVITYNYIKKLIIFYCCPVSPLLVGAWGITSDLDFSLLFFLRKSLLCFIGALVTRGDTETKQLSSICQLKLSQRYLVCKGKVCEMLQGQGLNTKG